MAGVAALAVRHSPSPKPVVLVPQTATTIHCGDTISVSIVAGNGIDCAAGSGLTVGANAIIINLNGHALTGTASGYGIINSGHSGVTIENGSLSGWSSGVYTTGATNKITGLRVSASTNGDGIVLLGAGALVSGNVVFQNNIGIFVNASNVKVTSNVARENGSGIQIFTGIAGASVQTNQSENNTMDGIDDEGAGALITGNITNGNTNGDGIRSSSDATSIVGTNTANYNGAYGIQGSPGGKDSGGNLAKLNGAGAQCKDVVCA